MNGEGLLSNRGTSAIILVIIILALFAPMYIWLTLSHLIQVPYELLQVSSILGYATLCYAMLRYALPNPKQQ